MHEKAAAPPESPNKMNKKKTKLYQMLFVKFVKSGKIILLYIADYFLVDILIVLGKLKVLEIKPALAPLVKFSLVSKLVSSYIPWNNSLANPLSYLNFCILI